jgi:hypothetical protein
VTLCTVTSCQARPTLRSVSAFPRRGQQTAVEFAHSGMAQRSLKSWRIWFWLRYFHPPLWKESYRLRMGVGTPRDSQDAGAWKPMGRTLVGMGIEERSHAGHSYRTPKRERPWRAMGAESQKGGTGWWKTTAAIAYHGLSGNPPCRAGRQRDASQPVSGVPPLFIKSARWLDLEDC